MIHPIPAGTPDVLPDEIREPRKLKNALLDLFERRGYGEVSTPAIEYDETMARGEGGYDGLIKRFGLDLSATGFGLYLQRVHTAQLEEQGRGGS